jgi:hypothetical protein
VDVRGAGGPSVQSRSVLEPAIEPLPLHSIEDVLSISAASGELAAAMLAL